jgi:4-hydroxy-tetrahydrodipicolinate reductase
VPKSNKTTLIQVGVGAIGIHIASVIFSKNDYQYQSVVDSDPDKIGKDIGILAGLDKMKMTIKPSLTTVLKTMKKKPDIAIVATSSQLSLVKPTIMKLLRQGISVVSTCEELTYPWQTQPKLAQEIDQCAKEHQAAILATGVNPGFLMDYLPFVMSAVCKKVEGIQIERIIDATHRRLPFKQKIGTGLTREAFFAKVREGALRHIGLVESMYLLADRLGWKLDRTEDIIEPVIAHKQVFTEDLFIGKGDILGVTQTGYGYVNNKEVIKLFFRATIGEEQVRDKIKIIGTPSIEMEIKNGLNGDIATAAIIVNAIPFIKRATPGLHTMADILPISCSQ